MRKSFALIYLFFAYTSCNYEYKYCACRTSDLQLRAYNDVINELVEQRFYNLYLGEDEKRIFLAYMEPDADTAKIRKEQIKLQNSLFGDTARFCVLYLDTILRPHFDKLSYYEADTNRYSKKIINILAGISDNKQAILDSLNSRQQRYSSGSFTLCTSKMEAIEHAEKDIRHPAIGLIRLSKIFFNDAKNKGILYYEFICGGQCGKGELIVIERKRGGDRWSIVQSLRLWIS